MASRRRCDTRQALDLPRLNRPGSGRAMTGAHRPDRIARSARILPAHGESAAFDRGLLDPLTTIVSAAAAAILAARAGALDARAKADHSPVTAADHAAEAAILEGLARALPGVPVVSEEAAARVAPT